jgi:hypothetical protein
MATQRSNARHGIEPEGRPVSSARTNLSQDDEKFMDGRNPDWEKKIIQREDTNLTLPEYKATNSLPLYTDDSDEFYNAPVETAKELVTEVIHARDDPSLNSWTFRVWFLGEYMLSYGSPR